MPTETIFKKAHLGAEPVDGVEEGDGNVDDAELAVGRQLLDVDLLEGEGEDGGGGRRRLVLRRLLHRPPPAAAAAAVEGGHDRQRRVAGRLEPQAGGGVGDEAVALDGRKRPDGLGDLGRLPVEVVARHLGEAAEADASEVDEPLPARQLAPSPPGGGRRWGFLKGVLPELGTFGNF